MPGPLRILIFMAVTSVIVAGVHLYLFRRLFHDTGFSPRLQKMGKGALIVLAVLLVGARLFTRLASNPWTFGAATVGWFWMGLATYLFLFLLLIGAGRKLWARVRRPVSPSLERRQFLSQLTAGGALAATAGASTYGVWRAYHEPVINEVAVKVPGLPRALDGFTVVQVSDIHVGPVIQRRFMDAMVARCNALKPDLMAITGDLVDGTVEELGFAVSALSNLRSRHGSYFVTGNHEYYSGEVEWTVALERMGLQVLRNRHVRVGEPEASFDLIGVDDWGARHSGQGYDLAAAVKGRDLSRAAVLLAHQPANFEEAIRHGVGLQLSGHTHGGQFFPFTLAVSALWEYSAGLYREGPSSIYVSRGTGFWGPPLRVSAPPEIVKITLLA